MMEDGEFSRRMIRQRETFDGISSGVYGRDRVSDQFGAASLHQIEGDRAQVILWKGPVIKMTEFHGFKAQQQGKPFASDCDRRWL